jgi:GT2 family glycosyltransferase
VLTQVPAHPLVYAVVLNWNGWRDTVRCLASLRASDHPNQHVVVVDNGSTDGSPEHLAPLVEAPWGELVRADRNLGFTGGANLGLRLALERGADYAFLLNNDATVAPDCIATLVKEAERRPEVGLVGPKIVWAEEPGRIWSAGMSVAWHHATIEAHRNVPDDGRFDGCRIAQGLSGCALLVKRAVLERTGLLDERYFVYYEDLDWCLRARQAGFRCLYVGAARALHIGSATSNPGTARSQSAFLNYYAARNILLLLGTHAPHAVRPLALACQAGKLSSAVARVLAGGAVLRRPRVGQRAWALAAGAIDAARGYYGDRYEVQPRHRCSPVDSMYRRVALRYRPDRH